MVARKGPAGKSPAQIVKRPSASRSAAQCPDARPLVVFRRPAAECKLTVAQIHALVRGVNPVVRQRPAANCKMTLDEIQDSLNREGLGFILLASSPNITTRAALLKKDHLILPADVIAVACELADGMREMQMDWMGGDTSLGNALWSDFVTPGVKEAWRLMRSKDIQRAFATLLGLLLYMHTDDGWLRDQEVWCNWKEFSSFFSSISQAWKTLLSHSDARLGLASSGASCRSYRGRLLKMLQSWESETNSTLEEVFDEHEAKAKPRKVRVTIF